MPSARLEVPSTADDIDDGMDMSFRVLWTDGPFVRDSTKTRELMLRSWVNTRAYQKNERDCRGRKLPPLITWPGEPADIVSIFSGPSKILETIAREHGLALRCRASTAWLHPRVTS